MGNPTRTRTAPCHKKIHDNLIKGFDAVCRSVLQHVAVCCSVLQCVAARYSALQRVDELIKGFDVVHCTRSTL